MLVASEIIHYLNCKTGGLRREAALKIDISKAYDRVDWGYLFAIMDKMGFDSKWIGWMKLCITTINYSIMMNE